MPALRGYFFVCTLVLQTWHLSSGP
jgi:hypothetical protein